MIRILRHFKDWSAMMKYTYGGYTKWNSNKIPPELKPDDIVETKDKNFGDLFSGTASDTDWAAVTKYRKKVSMSPAVQRWIFGEPDDGRN